MALLDRDGVRIRYDVAGQGPAVLLTHGFSASSHLFAGSVEALRADHTVITWDVRGHAGSEAGADPAAYTVPACVVDMVSVLDAAGAERAVVGGHSLGGFLALELWLAHPERVRALVLIGTGPGFRKDEPREAWNRRAGRIAAGLEADGLAALGAGDDVRTGVHRDARGLALAARGILAQHDGRVIDALPAIDVPTLVVVGEHDAAFRAGAQYLGDRIPGAELVVVPGAGHAPNLSRPAEFHRHLRDFLTRLPVEEAR